MISPDSRRRVLDVSRPGTIETAVFGLSMLTGPLLSRNLGVEGRGSLAAVLVPLQLMSWSLQLGVPYAAAMMSRTEDARRLISSAWGLAVALVAPVVAVVFFLGPALLEGRPGVTLTWFRLGLLGVVLGMPSAVALQIRLMRDGATLAFSIAKSLHLVGYSVVVGVLAVLDRLTLASALATWVSSFVLAPAFVVLWLDGLPRTWTEWPLARSQLVFGKAKAISGWATASLGRVDQVFLAVLATPAQLGHYAVAATAAQVSLPFSKGLADVIFPRVATLGHADPKNNLVWLAAGISSVIGLATAIVAPFGIPFVFGAEFNDSVALLFFLLPGQVLFNTAWVVSAELLGRGQSGAAAQGLVAAAVVNILLIVPAINIAGPEGAAALTTASQGIYLVVVLYRRSTTSDSEDLRRHLPEGATL